MMGKTQVNGKKWIVFVMLCVAVATVLLCFAVSPKQAEAVSQNSGFVVFINYDALGKVVGFNVFL